MAGQSMSKARDNLRRRIGLALLLGGALLLALNGAYFGYVTYARQQVGDVTVQSPLLLPAEAGLWSADDSYFRPLAAQLPKTLPFQPSGDGVGDSPVDGSSPDLSALYPGLQVAPQFWADPLWAEPVEEEMPQGFRPVTQRELFAQETAPPTRVRIPAISLDAIVQGLGILDLGDYRAYETPNNVVGHIPESANPGELGNSWLFGHLESPIRGEGSVFRNLPQVYDLLRQGQLVYVIVDSADGSFLYQVRSFQTLPREDLSLWESPGSVVSLVTCWPRFKYDERIVVEAELIGVQQRGDEYRDSHARGIPSSAVQLEAVRKVFSYPPS